MMIGRVEERLRGQVAEEVRSWMARRRLSGVRLAQQIDRTQAYVSRRLTGEVAFDVDDLERIAQALDVPVARLFGEINDAARPTRQKSSTASTDRREPCRATGRRPLNISSATRRPRVISSEVAA